MLFCPILCSPILYVCSISIYVLDAVNVLGSLDVSGIANVTGPVQLWSTLQVAESVNVTGISLFQSDLTVQGNQIVDQALTTRGTTHVQQTLTVDGIVQANSKKYIIYTILFCILSILYTTVVLLSVSHLFHIESHLSVCNI